MNKSNELENESKKRILIFDGAMGTEIEKKINKLNKNNPIITEDIKQYGEGKCKVCNNTAIKEINLKKTHDKIINKEKTGDKKKNESSYKLSGKYNEKIIKSIKCNEHINLVYPEIIENIHREYIEAGADIIETNSFGGQKIVLQEYGLGNKTYEINKKAAQIAKKVTNRYRKERKIFVSGSIGPGSKLPSLNQIDFDTLFNSYLPQIEGLVDGGVDILQIETSQDILQAKIAYFAVKEVLQKKGIKLPVFIQLTFDENGKMLLGTEPEAVITAFYDLDIYALGVNCGVGPAQLYDLLRIFSERSPFKLVVIPNAGLPQIKNGKVNYNMEPEIFSGIMIDLAKKYNIDFVGGCCGTGYEHIKLLKEKISYVNKKIRVYIEHNPSFSSLYNSQEINVELKPLIIGERVNATGSKKVSEALLANDYNTIIDVALSQQTEGAHLLDLNLAYTTKDELTDIKNVLPEIIKLLKIPLSIDTTSIDVIEYVLKNYPGRCLINSMSFEKFETGARILKLVKKYGVSVICLTIDEKGLALETEKKVKVAKRIYEYAINNVGLKPYQLIFDPLTFSIAVDDEKGRNLILNTLDSIDKIKKNCKGSFVSLGISNVSYGLPKKLRKYINSVVLKLAIERGLDIAIISAAKIIPVNNMEKLIYNNIKDAVFDLSKRKMLLNNLIEKCEKINVNKKKEIITDLKEKIKSDIIKGNKKEIEKSTLEGIEKYGAELTLGLLLEGMAKVGELFEQGKIYLPFVLRAAEVMKKAVNILKPFLKNENSVKKEKGKIFLATVKGDIHDIGKNLVGIILENNGIDVYDLGVNAGNDKILNEIKKYSSHNKNIYLGLSGLLVKSAFEMRETLKYFNECNIKIPVIVGGAALNEKYVKNELAPLYKGEVFYAKDAFSALKIIGKGEIENGKSKKDNVLIKKDLTKCNYINNNIDINDIVPYLNKDVLFYGRWGMKNEKKKKLENYFQYYVKLIEDFKFSAIYKILKVKKFKDGVIIFDNKKDIYIKFGRAKTGESLADYFDNKNDIFPVYAVTTGDNADKFLKSIYKKNQYFEYFMLYGLLAQLTDSIADFIQIEIEKYVGSIKNKNLYLNKNTLKKEITDKKNTLKNQKIEIMKYKRFSFGYPSCPDIQQQKILIDILNAQKVGIKYTESGMLIPELSTAGFLILNQKANYITII